MASAGSAPKPVDPNTIIQAQKDANRVNRITPFGSQTYGPDGSLTTTLPEGTQTAFNNVTELAGNKQHLLTKPQGFDDLQNALMQKVMAQQGGGGQKGSPMAMPGQLNGKYVSPPWSAALNKVWGNQ